MDGYKIAKQIRDSKPKIQLLNSNFYLGLTHGFNGKGEAFVKFTLFDDRTFTDRHFGLGCFTEEGIFEPYPYMLNEDNMDKLMDAAKAIKEVEKNFSTYYQKLDIEGNETNQTQFRTL